MGQEVRATNAFLHFFPCLPAANASSTGSRFMESEPMLHALDVSSHWVICRVQNKECIRSSTLNLLRTQVSSTPVPTHTHPHDDAQRLGQHVHLKQPNQEEALSPHVPAFQPMVPSEHAYALMYPYPHKTKERAEGKLIKDWVRLHLQLNPISQAMIGGLEVL